MSVHSIYGMIIGACKVPLRKKKENGATHFISIDVISKDNFGRFKISVIADWILEREEQWKAQIGKDMKIPIDISAKPEKQITSSLRFAIDLPPDKKVSDIDIKDERVNLIVITEAEKFKVKAEESKSEIKAEESKSEIKAEESKSEIKAEESKEDEEIPINNMKDPNFLKGVIKSMGKSMGMQ
jgi:hypothetical protein